jgi:hypothetical protein
MYDSGGSWPALGGSGGGAIHLVVGGTTSVEGAISANGGDGYNWRGWGGSGSGGSVWIETGTLAGGGVITANGGFSGAGDGGGGRIAINRGQSDGFDVSQIQAQPGAGGWGGEAGTIYLADLAAPQVLSVTPTGVVISAVDHLDVTFTSALDESTLQPDEFILQTPAGVVARDQLAILPLGGMSYRISCPLQWAQGAYSLQIVPAIRDVFGLTMTNAFTDAFSIAWPAITGTIHTPEGWPVGGVTVLTNGTAALTTGTNGVYALVVPFNWSGTVSANLGTATFNPASRSFTNLLANAASQDITLISGYVPGLAWQPASADVTHFNWPTMLGFHYQLQSSSDLVIWQDCASVIVGTGGVIGLDQDTATVPYQFYRLRISGP